jgi:biotin-dependent carboxylase-like uncharacterized protein
MTGARTVTVVRPGALATVQDLGRPGWAHLGVPRSGALDPVAHALASRLVGNDPSAATVETTLDGVALRATAALTVAVTGARAAVLVNGRPAAWGIPLSLRAGDVVEVGRATAGVRSYVAMGGGVAVPPVLGSRATDLLSGLGPPPLAAGQSLRLGEPQGQASALDMAPYPEPGGPIELAVHPGPRRDWLSQEAAERLFGQTYRVAPQSNRVGLRLRAEPLARQRAGELPSEGIVWGGIQLLPDGQLVVFLADHPTTGGYPVIGVIDASGASACAQARPGAEVTLRPAAQAKGPKSRSPASPRPGTM